MKRLFIILAGLLCSLALIYTGYHLYLAFLTPKHPFDGFTYAPECESIMPLSNAFKDSSLECQGLFEEAKLLTAHPQLAKREGNDLTLFHKGQPIHHLVAATSPDDRERCDSYIVRDVLSVPHPETGEPESLAQIHCSHGEFSEEFIVLPDGKLWHLPLASASPDRRVIAAGLNQTGGNGDHSAQFTLYDWPSRSIIARFAPDCRILEWKSNTHLKVTCVDSRDRFMAFDADVLRDDQGKWTLKATRWLAPDFANSGFYWDGGWVFQPAFSLRWLPTFKPIIPSTPIPATD